MSDQAEGHPRDLLSAYLDDELVVEERAVVDRHLAGCEGCRAQLAGLARLARAIADDTVPPLPGDLIERTAKRLDEATLLRPKRFRFAVPATIAATIAAIGLLIALRWRPGEIAPTVVHENVERQHALSEPPAPPPPVAQPATPESRVDTGAIDELTASRAKEKRQAKPVVVPESVPEGEPAFSDEFVKDLPAAGRKMDGGIAGGVVGGVEGGVAAEVPRREHANATAPAPAAPMALDKKVMARAAASSTCADRWSDSGARAAWIVGDVEAAAAELDRIARESGGNSIWRGAADGRPIVLAIPRGRLPVVLDTLRELGATGLPALAAIPAGDDCVGVSIALGAR